MYLVHSMASKNICYHNWPLTITCILLHLHNQKIFHITTPLHHKVYIKTKNCSTQIFHLNVKELINPLLIFHYLQNTVQTKQPENQVFYDLSPTSSQFFPSYNKTLIIVSDILPKFSNASTNVVPNFFIKYRKFH